MKLESRISIITLGVKDLERAVRFYEAMGLKRDPKITDGVAFFQMGGMILALWPRDDLAADAGISRREESDFSGIALAYNTRSEGEVSQILELAEKAGGRIVKPPQRAFWGGMQGYFEDTEGHLWEVAHNPGFSIDARGDIRLPQ